MKAFIHVKQLEQWHMVSTKYTLAIRFIMIFLSHRVNSALLFLGRQGTLQYGVLDELLKEVSETSGPPMCS